MKTFEKDVAIPLQYLGAALLIEWNELPEELKRKIAKTAVEGGIIGLPATTQLEQQVTALIRGSQRDWNA
jgi:hypothetical protein